MIRAWEIRCALIFGLGATVAACSSTGPSDPSLDGWPLGSQVSCQSVTPDNYPPSGFVGIAKDHLGSWARLIIDTNCYDEGAYVENGQPILDLKSTFLRILVFTFDDGSRHAIGIVCPVEGPCELAKPAH